MGGEHEPRTHPQVDRKFPERIFDMRRVGLNEQRMVEPALHVGDANVAAGRLVVPLIETSGNIWMLENIR